MARDFGTFRPAILRKNVTSSNHWSCCFIAVNLSLLEVSVYMVPVDTGTSNVSDMNFRPAQT